MTNKSDCNKYYADVQKHKKQRRPTNVYVSAKQRRQLMTEVGDAGCILFSYYLEKSGIKDFIYSDEQSAADLGWNTHKVKRNRLALTKNGWYWQRNLKDRTGNVQITHLGKETVRLFKDNSDPFWDDLTKINKVMAIMEVDSISELHSDMEKAKAIWESLD